MNTYNYNPYSDYTTYNDLNRQTIVPNQSNLPGIPNNNQEEYASSLKLQLIYRTYDY